MSKPFASLSLDLDNKWSYMKTHGDAGWETFPSYLDIVCPRVVNLLAERQLKITFFVVGQDAALEKNHDALGCLSAAGHEIGNHSFHHEPWLHLYTDKEVKDELQRAQDAIAWATGSITEGFRGPGFSISPTVMRCLGEMGYAYDASTFPTFLGPLARAYYFMTAELTKEEREQRDQLFGTFAEGFKPLRPYPLPDSQLVEIPVTTMPLFKVPIHLSYVLYLGQYNDALAKSYFSFAMLMCRLTRTEPSLLLHPLDFMGKDDESDLGFFPAMNMYSVRKLELAMWVIDHLNSHFEVGTVMEHALRAGGRRTKKKNARTESANSDETACAKAGV